MDGRKPLRGDSDGRVRRGADSCRSRTILQTALIAANGATSVLARAVGSDFKGRISIVMYALAIGFAFVNQWISDALYVAVAILWLVPDTRIERKIAGPH